MTAPRILLHPGFHKTGTTSLQRYFEAHADKVAEHFTAYPHLGEAGPRARYYGHKALPWRLWAFRSAMRQFLTTIPADNQILMSRETLCGVMPGHHGLRGKLIDTYSGMALPLLKITFAEITHRFGPDVRVELLFTVRDRERWLRSVYGHLLRSYRITDEFADWATKMVAMPDLQTEARTIAAQLPASEVHIRALEDYGDAHTGMAAPVLELMGIPLADQADLPAATRENKGKSEDLEQKFLELNRSDLSNRALVEAKAALQSDA